MSTLLCPYLMTMTRTTPTLKHERLLEFALESAQLGVLELDTKTGRLSYGGGKVLLEDFGWSSAPKTLKTLLASLPPKDGSALTAALASGDTRFELNVHHAHPDRWLQFKGRRLDDDRVLLTFQDVTAEHAIRQDLKRMTKAMFVRNLQQAVITQLGQQVLEGDTFDNLLNEATLRLGELLRVSHTAVFEWLPAEGCLALRAGEGWNDEALGEYRVSIDAADMTRLLRVAEAHPLSEKELPAPLNDWLCSEQVSHVTAVPIRSGDQTYGLLCTCSASPRSFDTDELWFIRAVAGFIGATLGRIEQEEQIRHLAYHDALTGLPNRRHFLETAERSLAQAERYGYDLTLFALDLDRFKAINDAYGHDAGDDVLKQVTAVLKEELRSSDMLARMGGDEFAVLLHECNAKDAAKLAERIVEHFKSSFNAKGQPVHLGVSIGIATYPKDGDHLEALLSRADLASYRAKSSGGGFEFHNARQNSHSQKRLSVESDLRRSLSKDQFDLVYQPIYNLANNQPVGVEALLRWTHPKQGLISPSLFIPVAEESGLIRDIDIWVLRKVLSETELWRGSGRVSVNLSAQTFRDARTIERIAHELATTPVDVSRLTLEITESSTVGDPAAAQQVLCRLKKLGVHIAVDDFGTGYSSLAYLKDFPVDCLKIDQSFVQGIGVDASHERITQTVIDLAHNLNLSALAEGVETEAQRDWLIGAGCDLTQGYLMSKPVSLEALLS